MSALGHVWTAPWQELSDVLQHWSGAVTCPACLCGGCGRWPYCSARIGSQSLARTLKCADPNGLSRSPERPFLHYVVMPSPIGVADLCRQRQLRLLVSVTVHHNGPGHPRDLVGKCNGGHFRGSALD